MYLVQHLDKIALILGTLNMSLSALRSSNVTVTMLEEMKKTKTNDIISLILE